MLLVYPTLPLKGAKAMQAIETSTGTLRTALLWEKKKKMKPKPCGKISTYSVQEKTGLWVISIQMIYSLPNFHEFIGI